MTRRPTRLRDAALAAADFGLHVFPCIPRGKTPAVSSWEQAATRDRDQITAWWAQVPPYNIGAAAGRSGLVVIDLDDGRGDPAPDPFAGATSGRDVLAMLAERAGEPAPFDTWIVSTPTVINGSGARFLRCLRRVITTVFGLVASALSAGVLRRDATLACPVGGVS
ncbi:MAG: bifunctional DNA primase/polymerase [Pseudonocardia sp.]